MDGRRAPPLRRYGAPGPPSSGVHGAWWLARPVSFRQTPGRGARLVGHVGVSPRPALLGCEDPRLAIPGSEPPPKDTPASPARPRYSAADSSLGGNHVRQAAHAGPVRPPEPAPLVHQRGHAGGPLGIEQPVAGEPAQHATAYLLLDHSNRFWRQCPLGLGS